MTSFDFVSYDAALAVTAGLVVFAALLLLKAFIARQLRQRAKTAKPSFLEYAEQITTGTRLPFFIGIALLVGFSQTELSALHAKWLNYAWIIILVSQIALWGNRIIAVAVQRSFIYQRQSDPASATHLMIAGLIGRIVLWSTAALVVLDNLGFNITTIMASLGIGGIAVALAVQNILGDIFSSVSIALDKPFVIGDFIIVDSYMGTVEYVGMKTTRLRSLGGEQIVFSNAELLKCRIRNYKRMQERRVLFEFGIAYETPMTEIERLPQTVKDIVSASYLETRFDRAHFKGYGDSALLFEVVYYVLDPDYNKYMDIQQEINLGLLAALRDRKISFAYPTRTLYVAPSPANEEISNAAEKLVA
ncbi:mechanosensitive ion channel family protein [Noviherbaspirillum sp. Root189]|uniref:mechanosensitive ion channel family protein n=1 Tax=Noviherbaspirillum sp. Root189 TaxID=1736487 RepID=UPI000710DCE9|nr:mechanosensitive ion channel family protein [Noviherbaspirillum sp. Root189]KRB78318.1 mechanosensitive ion channel protein MscS [Noviherbaspirillum sp. Root189]